MKETRNITAFVLAGAVINARNDDVDYDYFNKLTTSTNPIRAWFHTRRYEIMDSTVRKYFLEGQKLVDLGAGSCEWNVGKLPVIGVDLNKDMLEYAKSKGHLKEYKVSSIDAVDFESNSVDIVVISEVLEHVKHYDNVIHEIHRILKPGGIVIASVPYDTLISFWKPFFFVNCMIHGYVLGNNYFKNKCGHINNFSPQDIVSAFSSKGFKIIDQFDLRRFTIFTVAQKTDGLPP